MPYLKASFYVKHLGLLAPVTKNAYVGDDCNYCTDSINHDGGYCHDSSSTTVQQHSTVVMNVVDS